ncbi:MAG: replicative DNA helicase [Phycisphaerales bacterium]
MDDHTNAGTNGRRASERRDARRPGAAGTPLRELFDRLPPHDPEAEAALLGAMLIDPSVTDEVIQFVPSGDSFYLAAHATIFDALHELHEHRRAGDLVLLKEKLAGKDLLDEVGGVSYLARIVEETPSAAAAPHYARVVRDKARLRGLITAAEETLFNAYSAGELGEDGVQQVLDDAEQRIFKITEQAGESDESTVSEILQLLLERVIEHEGRSITGLSTGFTDLDNLTTGLQPGELIIVAARPSMGKTALALNLAEQIAFGGQPYAERGPETPVGFFSLEMSREAIVQRLLTARAQVDAQKFRRNMLSDHDHARLHDAAAQLAGVPIILDDTPGLTVMQLKARARRMAARHGVRCLLIDYLQLMSAPHASRDGRQNEVSEISRQVKSLARELKLPIICLAQLNRASEQREGHRPRMADLRESGSIEQDADVIMLLHREEYYHVQNPDWALENPDKVGVAELIVAKQRNGPTDVVKLTWNAASTRFASYSRYRDDAPAYEPTSEPVIRKVGFAPGAKTGPVEDHRDGGGSDVEDRGAPAGDDLDVPF